MFELKPSPVEIGRIKKQASAKKTGAGPQDTKGDGLKKRPGRGQEESRLRPTQAAPPEPGGEEKASFLTQTPSETLAQIEAPSCSLDVDPSHSKTRTRFQSRIRPAKGFNRKPGPLAGKIIPGTHPLSKHLSENKMDSG